MLKNVNHLKISDIEVLLTKLGEIATRDIVTNKHLQGFKENIKVANDVRKSYEKAINKSILSNQNALSYQYIDDNLKIEN